MAGIEDEVSMIEMPQAPSTWMSDNPKEATVYVKQRLREALLANPCRLVLQKSKLKIYFSSSGYVVDVYRSPILSNSNENHIKRKWIDSAE